jgi:hypothetical protein
MEHARKKNPGDVMDTPAFLSPNGFAPELWGPGLWLAMTLAAANYPLRPTAKDAMNYYTFFYNLQFILPCRACRKEYAKMILGRADPSLRLTIDLFKQGKSAKIGTARKAVFSWIVQVHNVVNARLGKKQTVLNVSESEWARRYARLRRISRQAARQRSASNRPLN